MSVNLRIAIIIKKPYRIGLCVNKDWNYKLYKHLSMSQKYEY